MLDRHELLDENLNINPDLKPFLNEHNWRKCQDYVTISIIGPQWTGKSTLLNTLFKQKFFKVKKNNATGRTTIGADLFIIKDSKDNIFILIDSEGICWEARLKDWEGDKEKQSVFDTRLTSFILSSVDVLLINIMTNQVGQSGASWTNLVQDILEINNKFIKSKSNCKKTIIFVIRDFDERYDNKKEIKKKILEYLDQTKAEQFEENKKSLTCKTSKQLQKLKESYNIKFEFIENKRYEEEKFKNSWKSILLKIKNRSYNNKYRPAIRDLASYFKKNLKLIIRNYTHTAKQMEMFCLQMESDWRKELKMTKKKIKAYSDLDLLIQDKEDILK